MNSLGALLGIERPLLLAPMSGGPGTPHLVGTVSRSGGLGVLGVSGMTCETAAQAVRAALRHSGGAPVGVNAQVAPPVPATGDEREILAVLRPFRQELGLPDEPPEPPPSDEPVALIAAALEAGASAVTTFGDPGPALEVAYRAGVPLLAMVTSAEEAVRAITSGAQGVIAQGWEAGGHRGTYEVGPWSLPDDELAALLPEVVSAARGLAGPGGSPVPVVASGGIVDAGGVRAALAAGASGVSCGTVFLQASESGVPEVYRETLRHTSPDATVVTDLVTGRPARWVRNRLVDALVAADVGHAGWPRQSALLADLRRAAAAAGRADLLPMLAGSRAAGSGPVRPAAQIVAELFAGVTARR